MQKSDFVKLLQESVRPGTEMPNPGGGTSRVVSVDDNRVQYKRGIGKKPFEVAVADLWEAYLRFAGRSISTNDLKDFRPHVFDSNARPSGHNCHATFFMLSLQAMQLAGQITGKGVRGNPFGIEIPKSGT